MPACHYLHACWPCPLQAFRPVSHSGIPSFTVVLPIGRAFSPLSFSWFGGPQGFALGWDKGAPLALRATASAMRIAFGNGGKKAGW